MKLIFLSLTMIFSLHSFSQNVDSKNPIKYLNNLIKYSFLKNENDSLTDMIDVVKYMFNMQNTPTAENHLSHHYTVIPGLEYNLSTGAAVSVTSNYIIPNEKKGNDSYFFNETKYTQKKQFISQLAANYWMKQNTWNLRFDWIYMKYPQNDYGMGLNKSNDAFNLMNYSFLKLHQSILKKIGNVTYIGAGYYYDNHWNISYSPSIHKPVYAYYDYGFADHSISSGLISEFSIDTRKNPINPTSGNSLLNVLYRDNLKALGSDQNWSSLTIDIRKYFSISRFSSNILSFWSYNTFTLHGKPPYLDLPFTSSDAFNNSARGYIQGRFRSLNLLNQEVEYRFNLTENKLLGGVLFGNIQEFSDYNKKSLSYVLPGYGIGLRVKYNKKSNTNISVDYGWGANGSRGLFMNLGEVF